MKKFAILAMSTLVAIPSLSLASSQKPPAPASFYETYCDPEQGIAPKFYGGYWYDKSDCPAVTNQGSSALNATSSSTVNITSRTPDANSSPTITVNLSNPAANNTYIKAVKDGSDVTVVAQFRDVNDKVVPRPWSSTSYRWNNGTTTCLNHATIKGKDGIYSATLPIASPTTTPGWYDLHIQTYGKLGCSEPNPTSTVSTINYLIFL